MRKPFVSAMMIAALGLMLWGCETSPKTAGDKRVLQDESHAAMARLYNQDSSLQDLINRSYAYVIFPSVGKGGVIVGGAYGRGTVHEQGQFIGYADLTQASIGAQLGGQTYTELVVFQTQSALDDFKANKFSLAANASAVIMKSGAAAAARFDNGVAVFTSPNGGAMVEASIGGQRFTFVAASTTQPSSPNY